VRSFFPHNIHSTDDSGVYFVSADNGEDGCEWSIAKDDGTNTSVRSHYKTMEKSLLIGQRARMTWTESADGTVATPYISFLGLNARELPEDTCLSGIMVVPVEGLAIGGVNPDCKTVGYIVLVRNAPGIETDNFTNYRKTVFRKFVNSKRNAREGIAIPEEESAVSWQDGGGPQLKAITNEDSMAVDEDMKCTINKHSASRSAVEQPMDFTSIFKMILRYIKKITSKNRLMVGFKEKIHKIFCELQRNGRINLSISKLNCIIDFAICIPELLGQSVTQTRIIDGFVEAGMVDKITHIWPDFDWILSN